MSGSSSICIGTSGWHYKHWKGPFYPNDLPNNRMLAYYSERFPSVEINGSFYKLPTKNALAQWSETVPESFVFAAKASRFTTHMKKLNDPKKSTALFFERIRTLQRKLGPVLFQLPPRWGFNEERFRGFLDALSTKYRYAFEFRDRDWLNRTVYALLEQHNAAFCIYELNGFVSPKEITADFVYVRLHGPDGPYQGDYPRKTLSQWARSFSRWAGKGLSVYCYFDNDQAGYAAKNAAEIQTMVHK